MTVKMYGMKSCPDVRVALVLLENKKVEVDFRDFAADIKYLKEFLAIRDKSPLFDEIKARGGIGIPCFVSDDGSVSFAADEIA